jgi:hypothetical protein
VSTPVLAADGQVAPAGFAVAHPLLSLTTV